MKASISLSILFILLLTNGAIGQRKSKNDAQSNMNPDLFKSLKYRSVGPSRGGRATAIAGIPSKPFTFFMGATYNPISHYY